MMHKSLWVLGIAFCTATAGWAEGDAEQPPKPETRNFMSRAARYDFSTAWRHEGAYVENQVNVSETARKTVNLAPSDVIGFCGKNYQRFYIHYNEVKKDPADPYLYHVVGKTRLGNDINGFSGTLRIRKVFVHNGPPYSYAPGEGDPPSKDKPFEYGGLVADVLFKDAAEKADAGVFKGTLVTSFHIKHGRVYLMTTDMTGDVAGDSNDYSTTWTNAQGSQRKTCNWTQGDTIPNSEGLFWRGDDRSNYVKKEYYLYGWASYGIMQRNSALTKKEELILKRAEKTEKTKWWLK